MSVEFFNKGIFFGLPKLKTVVLILVFFTHFLSVSGQELSKSVEDSPCKATRLASGQGNFESASRLIKQCLESGSKVDVLARVENLLLGAEIEFYLENDRQAADYAALAENQYTSLSHESQRALWLFSVKLKKVQAALKAQKGEYQPAVNLYKEGLAILASPNALIQKDGGEPRRLKADLLSGVSLIQLKTGLYAEAIQTLNPRWRSSPIRGMTIILAAAS